MKNEFKIINEFNLSILKKIWTQTKVIILFSLITVCAYATNSNVLQEGQRQVTGIVTDETGETVIGATVLVKGTTIGTVTDKNGSFSLGIPNNQAVLQISFVGYTTQEITVGDQRTFNVRLVPGVELEEIVVTAMGNAVESRKVGYALTTIKAAELTRVGTPNFVTALYGKASGVTIQTMQGGSAAGVSINVRGVSTMMGNTQPLVIVNGVPIRNGNVGAANVNNFSDFGSEGRIRSNGIVDINPDDIESLTILKGAAATALYGSEAANGAVLITSKRAQGRGVSVDVNATVSAGFIANTPTIQSQYGPGNQTASWSYYEGLTQGFVQITGADGTKYHAARYTGNASFGPRYDGQTVMYWDGTERKYEAIHKNPWKELFRTSINQTYNIALNYGGEIARTRFAYTFVDEKPNNLTGSWKRHNFNLTGDIDVLRNVKLSYSTTYMVTDVWNRARNTFGMFGGFGNMFQTFLDIPKLKSMYKTSLGYRNVWRGEATLTPNESFPFTAAETAACTEGVRNTLWDLYDRNTYETENRIISSVAPSWEIIKGLTLRGRLSTDITTGNQDHQNNTERPNALSDPSGSYSNTTRRYNVYYGDVMLMFDRNLTDDFGLTVNAGWSGRKEKMNNNSVYTNGGLTVENMFALNVSRDQVGADQSRLELLKTAWLGTVGFSFRNYAFLEFTGRQEKSSTLKKGSNSYFYPAVSLSFIFTDAFREAMPSWFDSGKFRASFGKVGLAPEVYWANVSYNVGSQNGFMQNSLKNDMGNDNIKPETTTEWEVGVEGRLFQSRLRVEFSYYERTHSDQILRSPLSASTGASTILLNIGEMTNKGIELSLTGTVIQKNDFNWDLRFNYANPLNKITKLMDGVDYINNQEVSSGGAMVRSDIGRPMGDIYTFLERRAPDGQKIVGTNGNYNIDVSERKRVVNSRPKMLGGLGTSFGYKNLFLDMFTDFSIGGHVISEQWQYMTGRGLTKESLRARDQESGGLAMERTYTGPDGNPVTFTHHRGMILDGVQEVRDSNGNPTGEYAKNDVLISSDVYFIGRYIWGSGSSTGGTMASAIMENSYWKMREIAFGYRLPTKFTSKFGCKNLSLSVFGRNLFYIYKTIKDFDPESGTGTGWLNQVVIGSSTTPTRTFGASLRATF